LLDKMLILLNIVPVSDPFYFVGDAYYAARKIANGLLQHHNHLTTGVKSNAVAYAPYVAQGPKKRGPPRLYGQKIALKAMLTAGSLRASYVFFTYLNGCLPGRCRTLD
jgi:hypothetical protein